MNDDKTETREKLKRFVSELKSQEFPISTISIDLAKFVALALEDYLNGNKKSLDAAFGLTPNRGVPGYPKIRKDTARKILQMRIKGKSWKKIANELPGQDERNLRRYFKEFIDLVTAEELVRRLNENDKKEGRNKST